MGAAASSQSSPACDQSQDNDCGSRSAKRLPSDVEQRILRLIGAREVKALFLTSKSTQEAIRPAVLETETFIFRSPQSYQPWRAFFPACKAQLIILNESDAWDNGRLALLAQEPRIEYEASVTRGDEGDGDAADAGLQQLTLVQELTVRLERRIGQPTPTFAFLSQLRHLRVLHVGFRFNPLLAAKEGLFNASALSGLAHSLEHLHLQNQSIRVADLPLYLLTRLQSLKLVACTMANRPDQQAAAGAADFSACPATHLKISRCRGRLGHVLGVCVNAEELNIVSNEYETLQLDIHRTRGMRRLRSLTIRGHARTFFRNFLGDLGGSLEKLVLRGSSPNSRVLWFHAEGFSFAAMVMLQELTLENCSFPDDLTVLPERDCFPALRKLTMTRCRSEHGIILQACRTAIDVRISCCSLSFRAFGGLRGVEQLQLEHYFPENPREQARADFALPEATDGTATDDEELWVAEKALAALSAQLPGMRSLKRLTVRALDRNYVRWGLLAAGLSRGSGLRLIECRDTRLADDDDGRGSSAAGTGGGSMNRINLLSDAHLEASPFAVFERAIVPSGEGAGGVTTRVGAAAASNAAGAGLGAGVDA